MASAAQRTQRIRDRKLKRRGSDRKHALENHGSTPTKEELFKVQPASK